MSLLYHAKAGGVKFCPQFLGRKKLPPLHFCAFSLIITHGITLEWNSRLRFSLPERNWNDFIT
jgi:hypothetical protein